jgi:signal transduction histidine kinase/ActR/RegA family two-component response regulator
MTPARRPPIWIRVVSAVAGAYALLGGGVSLLGWLLNVPRLAAWFGNDITIKPNAAICAMAGGAGLILLAHGGARRAVRGLALLLGLIAGLTGLEHLTGLNLGIDTLLFDEPPGAPGTSAPGRMGPPASTSFSLLGAALWLAAGGPRARRVAPALALGIIAIAALGIVGYLHGVSQLFAVARLTGIALQTATMIAALGFGLLLAVPEHGLLAALGRDDPGGLMFRRLIAGFVLLPLAMGWLVLAGEQAAFYDTAFGTAVRTLSEIVLFVGLLWWAARGVSRQARAARQAEQSLREADSRKDAFLATLAHELRNPLAPLRNALEMLRRRPEDATTRAQAHATMERQLGQLVHLVDDLLDVGRITRGSIELRRDRVALGEILEHAIETCRPLIDGLGHHLLVRLPARSVLVHGDTTRLTQVVANLIHNAAKYTERGGRIDVELKAEGDEALVAVRDSGVGIPPELVPRIFDMFTRIATPLDGSHQGLGIGLALVKQIVELHGGRVEVWSPPRGSDPADPTARGSEFIVHLPRLAAPEAPAAATPSAADRQAARALTAPGAAQLRVLIADDNGDARDTMAMLLEELGYQTRTAHDGLAALEVAGALRPHVAFLDIGMPGLDGYQVCRRIRAEPWGKAVVLVALTGWGQPEDRHRSADAGFDHHLVKPASLGAMEQILASAAGSTA